MDDDILKNLTQAQLEAVTHRDGPMLVVAGAGSGKTRVVTRRIAYLISSGVWPSQILAMTFTNKAAREMKERIALLVHGEPPRNIGTFHGCCARFLRQDIERLADGRTRDFTIYDDSEQQAIIKQVIKAGNFSLPRGITPKVFGNLVSSAKSQRIDVDVLAYRENYDAPDILANIANAYEAKMRQCNAVDFDDLLLLTARLLEEVPGLADIYHNRFRYLLIDEYQDTNHLQYELMRLLTGPAQNVHVTGDPDQSIYSWRGADYSNIMSFTQDFPDAKVVRLEQNYRSTQAILKAANTVIVNNVNRLEKELFTENDPGCPVREVTVRSDRMEGEWLGRRILQLRADGADLRDMAVFYRTNSQSRLIEDAFIQLGIPYQLLGGVRFYERKEIKDLLAFLRLKVNHCDLVSLERIAGCRGKGIGPRTLATLTIKANEIPLPLLDFLAADDFPKLHGKVTPKLRGFADFCKGLRDIPEDPLDILVGNVLEYSGLMELYEKEVDAEERQANLKELVTKAAQFADEHDNATLAEFLEDVALVADVDACDPNADFVTMMTLHSSKGLEYPYVFITGLEEGYLPHSNCLDDPDQLEEERRLFYVGITRAERELTLIHSLTRFFYDGLQPRTPSRFLRELPAAIVKHLSYGVRSTEW